MQRSWDPCMFPFVNKVAFNGTLISHYLIFKNRKQDQDPRSNKARAAHKVIRQIIPMIWSSWARPNSSHTSPRNHTATCPRPVSSSCTHVQTSTPPTCAECICADTCNRLTVEPCNHCFRPRPSHQTMTWGCVMWSSYRVSSQRNWRRKLFSSWKQRK